MYTTDTTDVHVHNRHNTHTLHSAQHNVRRQWSAAHGTGRCGQSCTASCCSSARAPPTTGTASWLGRGQARILHIYTELHPNHINTSVHGGMRHYTAQHNTTQHNTTQHNTTQHNTTQHNTIQHNTTQHNTAQHSPTQHNTTQHSPTQPNKSCRK